MKITAQVGEQVHEVVIERRDKDFMVEIDGAKRQVNANKLEGDFYSILSDHVSYEVSVEAGRDGYYIRHGASERHVRFIDPSRKARELAGAGDGPQTVEALMPGQVVRVMVKEGDKVAQGQGLLVIEAMKMENEITAHRAGKITALPVEAGAAINSGDLIARIE